MDRQGSEDLDHRPSSPAPRGSDKDSARAVGHGSIRPVQNPPSDDPGPLGKQFETEWQAGIDQFLGVMLRAKLRRLSQRQSE